MDFIPIAEETGEIFAIGEWVLREAAREAASWDNLKVAVNLSPVQLLQRTCSTRMQGGRNGPARAATGAGDYRKRDHCRQGARAPSAAADQGAGHCHCHG
jgi:hypothetical protein